MTKPVLDADGMAEYLKGVSQADWPQLIELWRLQQYAAGHRAAENTRRRYMEAQNQFDAGRHEGLREAEARRGAGGYGLLDMVREAAQGIDWSKRPVLKFRRPK